MPIPGLDLDNVCVLRTPEDANRIAANSKGKKVVIIGSSFIGESFLENILQNVCFVCQYDVQPDMAFFFYFHCSLLYTARVCNFEIGMGN